MKRIAIIPARGGSQRIKNKNIRGFHGKPIIAYSIQAAKKSGLFDDVYITTDSAKIGKVAMRYGAKVIWRQEEYARNEVGTQEVIKQTLLLLNDPNIDYVCCLYATSPLLDIHDLTRGFNLLNSSREMDYSFSVGTEPLHDAGNFYWMKIDAVLNDISVHAEHSIMVPIAKERVQDINIEEDWLEAERKFNLLKVES